MWAYMDSMIFLQFLLLAPVQQEWITVGTVSFLDSEGRQERNTLDSMINSTEYQLLNTVCIAFTF